MLRWCCCSGGPSATPPPLLRQVSAAHVITSAAMSAPYRHHPSLEVLGGAADAFLPALKTLQQPYQTYPFIGWNRHLETIFAAFFRKLPEVRLKRECLRTLDDGSVALDWVSGDDGRLPADSPLLVLLVYCLFLWSWLEWIGWVTLWACASNESDEVGLNLTVEFSQTFWMTSLSLELLGEKWNWVGNVVDMI